MNLFLRKSSGSGVKTWLHGKIYFFCPKNCFICNKIFKRFKNELFFHSFALNQSSFKLSLILKKNYGFIVFN